MTPAALIFRCKCGAMLVDVRTPAGIAQACAACERLVLVDVVRQIYERVGIGGKP